MLSRRVGQGDFARRNPLGPEGSNGRRDVRCLQGCGMELEAWPTILWKGCPPQGVPAMMSGSPSLVGRQPAKLMGLRPRGFKSHPRRYITNKIYNGGSVDKKRKIPVKNGVKSFKIMLTAMLFFI